VMHHVLQSGDKIKGNRNRLKNIEKEQQKTSLLTRTLIMGN